MTKEIELLKLIRAVDFGKGGKIKQLVAAGANVNHVYTEAEQQAAKAPYATPLIAIIAIAGNSSIEKEESIFHLLVELGANTSYVDEAGNTLLLLAIKYHALNIMSFLVQQGANIHAVNKAGENAFHIIMAQEREEIALDREYDIKLLISSGRGTFPIERRLSAFDRMQNRIIAIVKSGYNLNAGNNSAAYDAITAISERRVGEVVLYMICENGADVLEFKKEPLLEYALQKKLSDALILFLMSKIGNTYAFKKFKGFTVMDFAIAHNRIQVAEALLLNGFDVHINDAQVLRHARKSGHAEIIKLLEKASAKKRK